MPTHGNISTITFDDNYIKKINDYWTIERIKETKPFPLPHLSEELLKKHKIEKMDTFPKLEKKIGEPVPADINIFPYKCGGALFFTTANGNYRGSAQFVADGNMIFTAAHCIRDGKSGEFHKNFLFIRGFNNGEGQRIPLRTVGTWDKWVGYNSAYDYAFANTEIESDSHYIDTVLLGRYEEEIESIGYPGNFGDGQIMYTVNGQMKIISEGIFKMEGNPMGGGCSGGAWFTYLGTNFPYVVGLNSFRTDDPDDVYGPRINEKEAVELYNRVYPNLMKKPNLNFRK